MDSVRLFYVNLFMYAIFLETYVVGYFFQQDYGHALPYLSLIIMGVFTFLIVMVWMNVAHVWYLTTKMAQDMLLRSLISELPFVVLLFLVWVTTMRMPGAYADMRGLIYLFWWYMVTFPAIMVLAKSHKEKTHS